MNSLKKARTATPKTATARNSTPLGQQKSNSGSGMMAANPLIDRIGIFLLVISIIGLGCIEIVKDEEQDAGENDDDDDDDDDDDNNNDDNNDDNDDSDTSPSTCNTCHGFPPTTGSHDEHTSYGCSTCHGDVVDADDTIIDDSLHQDGDPNVSPGSGSYDPTSQQCSSVGCHGDLEW